MKLFYLLILFQKKLLNKKKNSEPKNKIETLYLSIHLDKNKITKKLMSLLIPATDYYYKILKSISDIYLLLDETKKELKIIENNLFQYKNCKLIILYFKLYSFRMIDSVTYLFEKGCLFSSNEKNFSIYGIL